MRQSKVRIPHRKLALAANAIKLVRNNSNLPWIEQQLNKAANNTGFDNSLDFLIGSVGQVRQRPASIGQHFFIWTEDQLCQCHQNDVVSASKLVAQNQLCHEPMCKIHALPQRSHEVALEQIDLHLKGTAKEGLILHPCKNTKL